MNIGQIIVIGLSLTLVLWFLGGTWYNRRRANQIWRWLEPGLEVLGGRVGKVWIGASGAGLRVAVDNPAAPLRRLECIVALESRENLPLWLFERSRGKRDQLTLRAQLRSSSQREVEAVPVGGGLDRALQAQTDAPWQLTDVSPHWAIAQRGSVREGQFEALGVFLTTYQPQLQRFSVRRAEPHLFILLRFDGLMDKTSHQLLSELKAALTF
jgi:hypothetical protein